MQIASLGSGSKGNATVVATARTTLMVDCGFTLKDLTRRAAGLSFDLQSLDGILVTHEHSDHCSGVAALARSMKVPVYLTHGTAASGRIRGCDNLRCFDADSAFSIGDIRVRAIPVPHDAREPVQYRFDADGGSIGILTDLGSVTPHVIDAYAGCDLLMLEFNHDVDMLREGPYPPALKRRVGGDWGHLSNVQALQFLQSQDHSALKGLIIAHRSEQNNCDALVEALLRAHLPELMPRIHWAEQAQGCSWLNSSDGADGMAASLASPVDLGAY